MTERYYKRDKASDSLKYLLICTVIIGHIIEKGCSNDIKNLFNFIYLFHMPLFIFLSGRFTRVTDKRKSLKGIAELIYIYVIATTIYVFFDWCIGISNFGFNSIRYYLVPHFHLWYLISLSAWRLSLFLIHKITPPTTISARITCQNAIYLLILVASCTLRVLIGYLDDRFNFVFSFSRTIFFYPYFLLGYMTKGVDLDKFSKHRHLAGLLLMIALIMCGFANEKLSLTFGCYSYNTLGYSNLQGMLYCVLLSVTSIIVSACFISVTRKLTSFSEFGKNTLFIYNTSELFSSTI